MPARCVGSVGRTVQPAFLPWAVLPIVLRASMSHDNGAQEASQAASGCMAVKDTTQGVDARQRASLARADAIAVDNEKGPPR